MKLLMREKKLVTVKHLVRHIVIGISVTSQVQEENFKVVKE